MPLSETELKEKITALRIKMLDKVVTTNLLDNDFYKGNEGLSRLKYLLEEAVTMEHYEAAAKIRDEINLR